MLKVGQVTYSNKLQSNVICVEDDFFTDRYGCNCCCFNDYDCINCTADSFTDRFECRSTVREDGKDVHFEIHE